MLSNQIMFESTEFTYDNENRKFVIPQLLPDETPLVVKSNKNRIGSLKHRIEYAFLHRDIIERFIVRTAQFSVEKAFWKNGVFIEFENAFAIIEVIGENDNKVIEISCFDAGKEKLLQRIREEFNKIRPLTKAKEFEFISGNWVFKIDKLENKDSEKSGFVYLPLTEYNNLKKLRIMDLLPKAVEIILGVFNNKALKKFGDDFVTDTVNWIRPLFIEDPKLIEKLETEPTFEQTKNRLSTKLEDLLEAESFVIKMKEVIAKGDESAANFAFQNNQVGDGNVAINGIVGSVSVNIHKSHPENKN